MIVCDFPGGKIVAYIDRVLDDGGAIYNVLSGQLATVDPDGISHPASGELTRLRRQEPHAAT